MSSYCLSPYLTKENLSVSCGKCANCRKKQSSEWSFRMKKEIEYWPEADVFSFFLTLTYDDDHLPLVDGRMSLRHDDYTKFIKRIRQQLKRDYGKTVELSIIGCGEYGDRSGRPHYHCVIHGVPFTWRRGYPGILRTMQEKWSQGYVYLKLCNGDVASYVTKYSVKNLNKRRVDYEALGVEAPFRVYSHGIGRRYFEANQERIRREGFCRDGRFKISIPKYFKDRFFRFCDYVRSRKVAFDRSVELLRKKSKVFDGYVLDTSRLAYLAKYISDIQKLMGRLVRRSFMWFCCCGSSTVMERYVWPLIDSIDHQIETLGRMLLSAYEERERVRGYSRFRELLPCLHDIEMMLARQARDDIMSRGYFVKRLI